MVGPRKAALAEESAEVEVLFANMDKMKALTKKIQASVNRLDASGKAVQEANLGFNPIVDGKLIRIPLPEMSRERRLEFVKTCHKLAEDGRVHVRNIRRDALETLKKAKLPEDEAKRLEKDIQAATDKSIKDIGDHLAHKEKDLLTV